LHFFGRQGDTIRRKGHNIPVFHVEEAARSFPLVREACVVPIELPNDEYDLKLIVVPDGAVDLAALMAHLKGQLNQVMLPTYYEIREELPRTRTLKILKTALRTEGINGLTATTLRGSDWQPALSPQDRARLHGN
jgi:acyl-coenzyme A synthetase/AMP-(fatty) acid ligase